jgi:hypothetical protein
MITKELIDRIIEFDGGELPVVSIYATGDRAELPVRVTAKTPARGSTGFLAD